MRPHEDFSAYYEAKLPFLETVLGSFIKLCKVMFMPRMVTAETLFSVRMYEATRRASKRLRRETRINRRRLYQQEKAFRTMQRRRAPSVWVWACRESEERNAAEFRKYSLFSFRRKAETNE